MHRGLRSATVAILLAGLIGVGAHAIRWSPGELDLMLSPGDHQSVRLLLKNDSEKTAALKIHVGDWLRDEYGTNDFSVPMNGARWTFDRAFAEGEVVSVQYTVAWSGHEAPGIHGSFRTWVPQKSEPIDGPEKLASQLGDEAPPYRSSLFPSVLRRVEPIVAADQAIVTLTVRCGHAFRGLTIEEVLTSGSVVTSIDDAGGTFCTINQSNADWIALSHREITLGPNETREIVATIDVPENLTGTTWSIIHAESRSVVVGEIAGTQIVSRPSVGLKVFVTAPGTEILAGEVVGVRERSFDPLSIDATFENTGNVQLVVRSDIVVVDASGATVWSQSFSEFGRDYFRILPGSQRTITFSEELLDGVFLPGIYQAIVSFDYGGDVIVRGVRAFRVG